MSKEKDDLVYKLNTSAILTVLGIVLLFGVSIAATLVIPQYVERTWIEPTSPYQKQMYEVADPHLFVSTMGDTGSSDLQMVYHLEEGVTLLAFTESDTIRIVAPPELKKYITRSSDAKLKLTSELLLLRPPENTLSFSAKEAADALSLQLQQRASGIKKQYQVFELFRPEAKEAFSAARTDGIIEDWVDTNYLIVDHQQAQEWHSDPGVVYVNNPVEYRVRKYRFGQIEEWQFDPTGETISSLQELTGEPYGFISRKDLIVQGEQIYQAEGCWYCHTDQTRTLIQDVVLNGAENEPAPPSTASEYVYQHVTFPGTRRIGPDLSRTGVKRPSRDWHKAHFWSPKTESPGSIMPRFHHFFDNDPRGTSRNTTGVPNVKFEAIFQYLMTKGTRITAPTRAWWNGKDPIDTKAIIEGRVDPQQVYEDVRGS